MGNLIKYAVIILAGVALFAGALSFTSKSDTAMLEQAQDAVVLLSLYDDEKNPNAGGAFGSGFFVGENKILTNAHVANGTKMFKNFKVFTKDSSKSYEAEVVASDTFSDVAIVKIKDSDWERFKADHHYQILTVVDADKMKQGDLVYAIGHPEGLDWSVTKGIINRMHRHTMYQQPYDYFIQTDAGIYHGNSGGPLLNDDGEVIGINSQKYDVQGGSFGFAIPGEKINRIVADLEDGDKKVAWATLGIQMNEKDGAVILESVDKDGPSELAGVQNNDILVKIDGEAVSDSFAVLEYLSLVKAGTVVTVEIKRGNEIKTIPITTKPKFSDEFGTPTPDLSTPPATP